MRLSSITAFVRKLGQAKPAGPVLKGNRIFLRLPLKQDFADWARLRQSNFEFLEPWEPTWEPGSTSRHAFNARLSLSRHLYHHGTDHLFFIFRKDDNKIIGGITLGNIRRGISQSAYVGYWLGKEYTGQGYMREAMEVVSQYAFTSLGLNRLEGAAIAENNKSIAVLEASGFHYEGTLRSYLKINGLWQDHRLYARLKA